MELVLKYRGLTETCSEALINIKSCVPQTIQQAGAEAGTNMIINIMARSSPAGEIPVNLGQQPGVIKMKILSRQHCFQAVWLLIQHQNPQLSIML